MQILQPLTETEHIDHKAVAGLTVVPGEGVQLDEDESKVILKLRGQLFGRFVSDGIFKQVVQEGDPAKYHVRVKVNAVNLVSSTARIMWGVFAGANKLDVRIELFQESSNNLIMAFTAYGESASHPFSGESQMDDAINEVVEKIILALTSSN